MRVVIDGRSIRAGKTGVGVYTENVVRELAALGRDDEFILIVSEEPRGLIADNLRVVRFGVLKRRFVHRAWENTFLPFFLRRMRADVYFSPSFILPLLPGKNLMHQPTARKGYFRTLKLVATVHDLVAFLYPQTTTRLMQLRLRLFLPPSLRVADLIITDSAGSKRDIVRLFRVPEGKVQVVPLGKNEQFARISDSSLLAITREQYKLPQTFILYVGTIEPRKNLDLLFRAYGQLSADLRTEVKLVVAGGLGWRYEPLLSILREQGLENDVHFTGYVSDEHLPALYNLANIFVYPSLYEGFGLPVLEAMACGLPVVVSNRSSLPEVVGDAGILIDPTNVKELARILESLLKDRGQRKKLAAASLAQAQKFSWRATAEAILEALRLTYTEERFG